MGRGFRILFDLGGTVRGSQSPLIKFRNETFTGGRAFLAKSLLDADPLCKSQYTVIFFRCHGAIQCFDICYLRQRCILIHDADIDMIPVGLVEIAQDFLRIPGLSRQDQVADDGAALDFLPLPPNRPGLPHHLLNGRGGGKPELCSGSVAETDLDKVTAFFQEQEQAGNI